MSKFSQLHIAHWINKVFPPAATGISNPGDFTDFIQLVQRALPPTATLGRIELKTLLSTNPSLTVDGPTIPDDRFWWVHASELFVQAGALAGAPNAQHARIQIRKGSGTADNFVTVARGLLQPGDVLQTIASHSLSLTAFDSTVVGFFTGGGGGCGGYLVMPGMFLQGLAQGPIGTAVLGLNIHFIEFLLGEEIPSIG